MIPALQPPDGLHLQAAEGWSGLGDYAAANVELEQISPANRPHPDVLQLRWCIFDNGQKSDACLDIASAIVKMVPEWPSGRIYRASSLTEPSRHQ